MSKYAAPEESIGYLFWRVSIKWRSAIEDVLESLDLTHPQFVILATIGWLTKDGHRATQVQVGRLAGLDPNTTSQIIRGLEVKRLLLRVRSDERSKHPQLTVLGSERLAQALPLVEQADEQFFRVLGRQELSVLSGIMKTMYDK